MSEPYMNPITKEVEHCPDEHGNQHVETLKKLVQQKKDKEFTEFYEFIKHGDEAHQAWIKGAIEGFFKVKIAR